MHIWKKSVLSRGNKGGRSRKAEVCWGCFSVPGAEEEEKVVEGEVREVRQL